MSEQEFENYLVLLARFLKLSNSQRDAIASELRDHLEERLAALQHQGVSRDEAIREALEEFGDAAGLANELSFVADRKAREQKRRWMMRLTAGSTAALVGAVLFGITFWPGPIPSEPLTAMAQSEGGTGAQPAGTANVRSDVDAMVVDPSPQVEKLRQALRKTTAIEFQDTPLSEVASWLETELGANVEFQTQALEDESIDPNSDTIRLAVKQMSLDSALYHMLRRLNLTYVIEPNVLKITSQEAAEEHLVTRIYPVWDLVASAEGVSTGADYDTLVEVLVSTIAPNSWNEVGGPGSLTPYKGLLTVSQTQFVHEELAELLATLRSFPQISEVDAATETIRAIDQRADSVKDKIEAALLRPVKQLEFYDTPLEEVAQQLAVMLDASVLPDVSALEDESVDWTSEVVTVSVKDLTLAAALPLILEDLNLTCVYDHEALVITSREKAEETLRTKVYQTASLLDNLAASNLDQIDFELDELQDAMMRTVAPESWDEVGGPGSVIAFPSRSVVVISQTEEVHQQVEELLVALQRGRSSQHAAPRQPPRDPDEIVVDVYDLADDYQGSPLEQQKLVTLIERLSVSSGAAINAGEPSYVMEILAGKLVVSHRRAVQRRIRKLLDRLGALEPGDFGVGFHSGDFGGDLSDFDLTTANSP